MQINYDGKEIETRPYLSTKEERAIRIKERKVLLETESIGNVIIKQDYYETKIYEVDGKKISGKECKTRTGWE